MRVLIKFFGWGVIFVPALLTGQKNAIDFQHLSLEDGLPNSSVKSICQDMNGLIWFGTEEGVCRYDGYNFDMLEHYRNQQLLAKNIDNIITDAANNLWVTTENDILYLDTRNQIVDQIAFETPDDQIEFLSYPLLDADTNVYIITNQGLFLLDKTSFTFKRLDGFDIQPGEKKFHYKHAFAENGQHLFFGSNQGVFSLDKNTKQLTRCKLDFNPAREDVPFNVTALFIDQDQTLWIGTSGDGLFKINVIHQKIKQENIVINDSFQFQETGSDSPGKNHVHLIKKIKNNIWIATSMGAARITHDGLVNWYLDDPGFIDVVNQNRIDDILEDSRGNIWISSKNNRYGLCKYVPGDDKLITISKSNNPNSLSFNSVTSIIEDHSGILWVGVMKNGVNKHNLYKKEFYSIYNIPNDPNTINSNIVFSFFRQGNILWIGTSLGLNKYNLTTGENKVYEYTNYNMGGRVVGTIAGDDQGNLWLGYLQAQLTRFDPTREAFQKYRYNQPPPYQFEDWSIKNLLFEPNGNLWIMGSRLSRYNRNEKQITTFDIKGGTGMTLIEETLWFGSPELGLVRFNTKTNQHENYQPVPHILCINSPVARKEYDEVLYLGTREGLFKFSIKTERLTNLSETTGFPTKSIYGILEDHEGMLWLSTNNGLYKFNPGNGQFKKYAENDGIRSREFNLGAYYKDTSGILYFGNTKGAIYFDPAEIAANDIPPGIVFTNLIINKKKAIVGQSINDQVILTSAVEYSSEISLNHQNNDFTIEFAPLHFAAPAGNTCKYRLDGYDKPDSVWFAPVNNQRFVSYTNLDPGKYVFKVKAANPDGVWNPEPLTLDITIHPPWWNTTWFRLLALLSIVLALLSFYFLKMRSVKRQHIILEHKVKERTLEIEMQKEEIHSQSEMLRENNEQLTMMNATKDKFFSIIAHDLRNPFQSITGIASLLVKEDKKYDIGKYQEMSHLIYDASKSASDLLENLLTWSRSQLQSIENSPTYFNIAEIIKKNVQLLKLHADKKHIALFNKSSKDLQVYADENMISTVVRNVLSNAIKFTPENGKVFINTGMESKWVDIRIKDTGVGMDEEAIKKLFKIDQQQSKEGTSGEKGTGLGLIICQEFVEKNNGKIHVESEPGKGTTFIISLPGNESTYTMEPREQTQENKGEEPGKDEKDSMYHLPDFYHDLKKQKERFMVLIVDDNPAIVTSLSEYLNEFFQIEVATDGIMGLELALEKLPDLIISDWAMPGMDGIDFCKKLKTDERTSHIPIIMLTAKSTSKDIIEGLETGADQFVTKPVESQVLIARISNLIQSRRRLLENFKPESLGQPGKFTTNKVDELFIQQVLGIIEENIADQDLSIDIFLEKTRMSRSSFYRKIKSITGMSVNDLIKTARLRKAAGLLKQSKLSVTEIAYETGFKTASHFSREFKQIYEVSPSAYKNQ